MSSTCPVAFNPGRPVEPQPSVTLRLPGRSLIPTRRQGPVPFGEARGARKGNTMAKLIYAYLASLDGYVADESGDFGWAYPGEEVLDFINAAERNVGTYLYGRTMYEMMAVWETGPGFAAGSPGNEEFARIWQAADKIVFSRTLEAASTKRTRIERGFDPGKVRALKETAQRDLSVSGAGLAAEAWRAGLVDECQVFVAPMLVGGGKRMFPGGVHQPLELIDERRFGNGMVFMRHRVLH